MNFFQDVSDIMRHEASEVVLLSNVMIYTVNVSANSPDILHVPEGFQFQVNDTNDLPLTVVITPNVSLDVNTLKQQLSGK